VPGQPPGLAEIQPDEWACVGRVRRLGVDLGAEIQTLGDIPGDCQAAGPEVALARPRIDLEAAAPEHLPLAEVLLGPDRQQQVGPDRAEPAARDRNEGAREHRDIETEALLVQQLELRGRLDVAAADLERRRVGERCRQHQRQLHVLRSAIVEVETGLARRGASHMIALGEVVDLPVAIGGGLRIVGDVGRPGSRRRRRRERGGDQRRNKEAHARLPQLAFPGVTTSTS
jgi:hypothetical protein